MLDVISGGRLVAGQVVGAGNEYFSYNVNPTYARERFREAHELILKAWTTPGPFAWEGEALPLPLRQPLAEAAAAAAPAHLDPRLRLARDDRLGGPAALRLHGAADSRALRRCAPRLPSSSARPASRHGYTAAPRADRLGHRHLRRRDRPRRRVEEYEPHFWYYAQATCSRTATRSSRRPATRRSKSVLGVLEARRTSRPGNFTTWEEIQKAGYVVVGSPATVRDRLKEIAAPHGLGR